MLSQKRLVLVSEEEQTTIPLEEAFDIVVGHVPPHLTEFFDDAVAIAYTIGNEKLTAIVEADADTITRFRTVLFKALLNGATARVKHPARVGGRITDATLQTTLIEVGQSGVTFLGLDPPLRIELSDVSHYQKTDRTIDDRVKRVLEIQFTSDGEAITSEVVMDSPRKMNILGRYIRLEYSELVSEMRDVELSEPEIEILTAVYSGAGGGNLSSLLGMEPSSTTMLLNSLEEKRLLAYTNDGTQLTSLGRLAVSERVESVNA